MLDVAPTTPLPSPLRLGFLLLPRFSLMAFSSASEPLRVANLLSGKPLYRWRLISPDGDPVVSSNGMRSVVDNSITNAPAIDMLVVFASFDPQRASTRPVLRYLQRVRHNGAVLSGVDTGSYVLANAGLLDGCAATIHWEWLDAFRERFPKVRATQDLFVMHQQRWSAAGGTACIDLSLNLIDQQHGRELATAVADQFVYSRIRAASDAQRIPLRERLAIRNPRLLAAVDIMEHALEEPLSTAAVAAQVSISLRELERLFKRWLGRTPGAFYRQLRLERAHALLLGSERSVTEIAVRCGFNSLASFSRCYKKAFGRAPRDNRLA
ncbi:MAG: GlxA family transcriptional regulator [Gammaproteobacteria bacterium]|nr:GlxA family transcriptional regulator [Gammaproteobacteria bacterium]